MEQTGKQSCCCSDDNSGTNQPCCGPGSRKKNPVKTVLSIALVVAALAVAGYALLCRGTCPSPSSESCPVQQK